MPAPKYQHHQVVSPSAVRDPVRRTLTYEEESSPEWGSFAGTGVPPPPSSWGILFATDPTKLTVPRLPASWTKPQQPSSTTANAADYSGDACVEDTYCGAAAAAALWRNIANVTSVGGSSSSSCGGGSEKMLLAANEAIELDMKATSAGNPKLCESNEVCTANVDMDRAPSATEASEAIDEGAAKQPLLDEVAGAVLESSSDDPPRSASKNQQDVAQDECALTQVKNETRDIISGPLDERSNGKDAEAQAANRMGMPVASGLPNTCGDRADAFTPAASASQGDDGELLRLADDRAIANLKNPTQLAEEHGQEAVEDAGKAVELNAMDERAKKEVASGKEETRLAIATEAKDGERNGQESGQAEPVDAEVVRLQAKLKSVRKVMSLHDRLQSMGDSASSKQRRSIATPASASVNVSAVPQPMASSKLLRHRLNKKTTAPQGFLESATVETARDGAGKVASEALAPMPEKTLELTVGEYLDKAEDQLVMKKRLHSKLWHGEHRRASEEGCDAATVSQRASEYAAKGVALWKSRWAGVMLSNTEAADASTAENTPVRRAGQCGMQKPQTESSEKMLRMRKDKDIDAEAEPKKNAAIEIKMGQHVWIAGDGWGGAGNGYEGIVTESDRHTFTVIAVSGQSQWKESHVLRDKCSLLASAGKQPQAMSARAAGEKRRRLSA